MVDELKLGLYFTCQAYSDNRPSSIYFLNMLQMFCFRSGSLILSCVFKMLATKDDEVETTHTELNNILQTNRDIVAADVILDPPENVVVTIGNVLGVIFCVN